MDGIGAPHILSVGGEHQFPPHISAWNRPPACERVSLVFLLVASCDWCRFDSKRPIWFRERDVEVLSRFTFSAGCGFNNMDAIQRWRSGVVPNGGDPRSCRLV